MFVYQWLLYRLPYRRFYYVHQNTLNFSNVHLNQKLFIFPKVISILLIKKTIRISVINVLRYSHIFWEYNCNEIQLSCILSLLTSKTETPTYTVFLSNKLSFFLYFTNESLDVIVIFTNAGLDAHFASESFLLTNVISYFIKLYSQIFNGFSKNNIVPKLKKIFFKLISCFFYLTCISINRFFLTTVIS